MQWLQCSIRIADKTDGKALIGAESAWNDRDAGIVAIRHLLSTIHEGIAVLNLISLRRDQQLEVLSFGAAFYQCVFDFSAIAAEMLQNQAAVIQQNQLIRFGQLDTDGIQDSVDLVRDLLTDPLALLRQLQRAFVALGMLGLAGQIALIFQEIQGPGYGGLILGAQLAKLRGRQGFTGIQVVQAGNMGASQIEFRYFLVLIFRMLLLIRLMRTVKVLNRSFMGSPPYYLLSFKQVQYSRNLLNCQQTKSGSKFAPTSVYKYISDPLI